MIEMKKTLSAACVLLALVNLHSAPAFANKQLQYQGLQQWCMLYLDSNKKRNSGLHGTLKIEVPAGYLSGVGHYCAAMNAYQKLQSTSDQNQRRHLLGSVIGETGYVVRNNAENHPHMAELYALRGRAHLFLKQHAKAEENLHKAFQLDPGHIDVYANLGNLYLNTARKTKASEITQSGLALDPQHRALRRLAGKLGINLAAVNPHSQNLKSTHPAPLSASVSTSSQSSTEVKPSESVVIQTNDNVRDAVKPSKNSDSLPSHIDMPRNPWCRFCSDIP
jgi:tetratricopeptide (TPR) repeat protein